MEYKIVDGELRLPVSELNRLNDGFARLESDRAEFLKEKDEAEKLLNENFQKERSYIKTLLNENVAIVKHTTTCGLKDYYYAASDEIKELEKEAEKRGKDMGFSEGFEKRQDDVFKLSVKEFKRMRTKES